MNKTFIIQSLSNCIQKESLNSNLENQVMDWIHSESEKSINLFLVQDIQVLYSVYSTQPTDTKLLVFTRILLLLFPITPSLNVFDAFWTRLFLPILSQPVILTSTLENTSQYLLQSLLSIQDPQPCMTMLSILFNENENQNLKQAIESIMSDYAIRSTKNFCMCMNTLCMSSKYRLSLFVLLTRILKRDDVPVYIILESPLLSTIMETCARDLHPVGIKASVSLLTLLLPYLSQLIASHFNQLFLIFIRLLKWESYYSSSNGHVEIKNEAFLLSIQSCNNYYFSHLYGMCPCNTLTYCQSLHDPQRQSAMLVDYTPRISEFEVWKDPENEVQVDGEESLLYVKNRIQTILSCHGIHSALLSMTSEEELQGAWFKDMDSSDIAVECLLLRRFPFDVSAPKNISSHALTHTPSHSPTHAPSHAPSHTLGNNSMNDSDKSESYKTDDKNSIIENVMETFSHLCKLDPYITVFPYRNSNIKSNEEALLLISLNFEAALRSRYTQYLLNMKKKMMSQEIQDANYHAIQERLKYQWRELKNYAETLDQVKKEANQSRERYRRNEEDLNAKNRSLREQVKLLSNKIESLELLNKQQSLEIQSQSTALLNQVHELTRYELQWTVSKKDMVKLEEYEKTISLLSEKLKNHPYTSSFAIDKDLDVKESLYIDISNLNQENSKLSTQVQESLRELSSLQTSLSRYKQDLGNSCDKITQLESKVIQNQEFYKESLAALESKYQVVYKINRALQEELMNLKYSDG